MRVRVFKKKCGGVIYSWPSKKYQDSPNFEGCKFPEETNGLEYFDCDELELPNEDGRCWRIHGPLFIDGEHKIENLKFDESWDFHVMSDMEVKKRYLEDLHKKIDTELLSENPDVLKVMKLKHEHETLKDKEASSNPSERNEFWLNISKEGLDTRVAKGKEDKLIVRQKLEEKLAWLKGK